MLLFQCEKSTEIRADRDISIFPEPGNYNEAFNVRISTALKDVKLKYTLDGSAPTFDSPDYTGEINIAESTIVQAAAYDADGNMLAGAGSVYLLTPGNGKPEGVLYHQELPDGRSRFDATVSDPENDTLKYRWYVDGLLVPGEAKSFFIRDLREQNERTSIVSVKIDDGSSTVILEVSAEISALPVELDSSMIASLTGGADADETLENASPELRLFAPYDMLEYGEKMRIKATASDEDGDSLEYLWMLNDKVMQRGDKDYFDMSIKPDEGRFYSVKVAVSDQVNVKTAALRIFVNEKQPEAVINSFSGKVEVLKNSGEWIEARRGMAVSLSDTISTGFGAAAEIKLGDSVLTVQPMSRITLDALSSSGGVQETSIYMRTGSVVASVDASEGAHDFEVLGPHATASVRGTQFSFDGMNLRVFEGKVALKMGAPQRNIQLNNQKKRKPAEADGEAEEGSADKEAAADDGGSEDSEEGSDSADEASDEVLVGSGESAEVDLNASGGAVIKKDTLDMDKFSSIQEISIPTHALVNVELTFSEVNTSSSIGEGGQIIMTGE